MTEYITKEAAIEAFMWGDADVVEDYGDSCVFGFSREAIKRVINDIPAADVAPVVRCRECKHCDPENYHCDHPMGTAAPLRRKPDDFCSYGERKEGADNG